MPARLRALIFVGLIVMSLAPSLWPNQLPVPLDFSAQPVEGALISVLPGRQTVPSTCSTTTASATPATVVAGTPVVILGYGFENGSQVTITITGPVQKGPFTVNADTACRATTSVSTSGDPAGTYSVTLRGTRYRFSSVGQNFADPDDEEFAGTGDEEVGYVEAQTLQGFSLNTQYAVTAPAATATPIPSPTNTPMASCPAVSAATLSARINPGQNASVVGRGFQPGSTVQIEIEGPNGRWNSAVSSPAGANCQVLQVFSTSATDAPGRYTATLTGTNGAGNTASAQTDFEILGSGSPVPSPTMTVGPGPSSTPTSTPTPGPPPTGPAPITISQSLVWTGGNAVPAVGEKITYDHTMNIRNTGGAVASRYGPMASEPNSVRLRAAAWDGGPAITDAGDWSIVIVAQGDTLVLRATTDYSPDTRIVSSMASVGTTSVVGSTLVWQGPLAPGETLTLRTSLEQVPMTAGIVNDVVRGQSLNATTPQGASLVVPVPARPLPPLPQRFVQPPPPPVDPATGPRFFADTGFGVADDNIWLYYIRRGGQRTFGSPISRLMLLNGAWVQLFEKGMLQVFEDGRVASVNLLEAPYLPYEVVSDLTLPPVDGDLIQFAPDPAAPDFAARAQEFVRENAPEQFEGLATRFYGTFLGTVLFRDAFFDGRGDPNLVPGFDLEIWGLPTSRSALRSLGPQEVDPAVALLRFQRGVMIHDSRAGTTGAAALGYYVRSIIAGDSSQAGLADVAAASPLWAQYDPNSPDWVARPSELAETNLVLVFTREDDQGEAVPLATPSTSPEPVPAEPDSSLVEPDSSPVEPDPGPAIPAQPAPGTPGARLFLEVLQTTSTFTEAGDPVGTAPAGEVLRILQQVGGRVQVIAEGESAADAVWIQLDGRVRATIR